MINAKLDGVARTVVMTLRARADEQQQSNPILDDKWSANWFEYVPDYDDYDDWYNPIFQLATVIRSKLIDGAVKNFLKSHDNPLVVELGAGLSTRYYRLAHEDCEWVEVDLPQAIAVRRKVDVAVDKHWFLPADITSENWFVRLPEYDAENILFIAEGVLMFIEPEGIGDFTRDIRNAYPGASFVFDVVNPDYIKRVADAFTRLEAPMLWGVTADDLSDYGFVVQHITHLLLEYPARWAEIGVEKSKLTAERSGYVVEAILQSARK